MLVLTVLQGPDKGRRFELPDDEPQLIGRSSEALPLTDQTISRRHAELTPDERDWYIDDLKSSNGSFVNGQRVTERRLLQTGDQIRTGNSLILYGREPAQHRHGVRVAKSGQMDAYVDHVVPSNDDSMIMAVPDPTEAAAVQLKVIYELTQLIGTIEDRQQFLEQIMTVIFEHFQPDRGFILLNENPNERPDPIVVRHRVEPKEHSARNITVSRTIVQHVMRRSQGVLSSNAMADSRFAGGDSVQDYGIRSAMCVPIKFKDRIYGVIHIDSQIENFTYTEDQLLLLTAVGVQTGMALANLVLLEERLSRERLAAVGETVASLSHSIKNILQGLRGGGEVIELGLKKHNMEVLGKGWQIVARNLDRIYMLTMNMLAYSKQRRPELDLTNLDHLFEEIAALVQRQYDDKNVALIVDVDAGMPPVPIDPGAIYQALLNLLYNALHAVERDTGVVSLGCHYDDAKQTVQFLVADNGEGIEQSRMDQLFEPFHSTRGLRGTGLGLVVTQKVVQEHGGRILVESTPGQGSTFKIELPIDGQHVPKSSDTHTPGQSTTAKSST